MIHHIHTYTFGTEIIRLEVPDEQTVRQTWETGTDEKPYWTRVWPSAVALCDLMVANPGFIQGKEVWECGAGLALPAILASGFATRVVAGDLYSSAVRLMHSNAELNKLKNFTARKLDWTELPQHITAQTVLLSDVNYEPSQFDVVETMINRFLEAGCTVLWSSPDRLTSSVFLEHLKPAIKRIEHMPGAVPVLVAVLQSDTPDHII